MTNVLMLFVVKLTLVLAIGAALAALLRHRSAAARHFVWALTLCGAVALAVAATVAPPIPVEIQDWRKAQPIVNVDAPAPLRVATPTVTVAQPAVATPVRTMPSWKTIAAATWLTGFAAVVMWLLAGHLTVRRIARAAVPANDDALIDEARRQIGVTRQVTVALSPAVTAPFTSGFARPVIFLPAAASTWPEERRRAALLHELAHVARNDYLVHLLAGFACALYWFHPAVWFALRGLRRESEQATDDRVIARGMMPPDYATHLLDVARGARGRGVVDLLVVGMACPSHLETRLRALLDETRRRGTVSRRRALTASVAAAIVLVPLAAAQPELRAAVQKQAKKTLATVTTTVTPTVTPSTSTATPTNHRVFDVAPGGTLILDLDTGGNVVITGTDEERVELFSYLRGRDAAHSSVGTAVIGNEVRVTATFDRLGQSYSTSHEFVLRVPRRFNVRLDSSGGGISITNVDGTFTGTTGGGGIELTRVSGAARLSTGGGDIHVSDADLEGKVTTGGGKVRFTRVRGGLRAASGSGQVIRDAGDVDNRKDDPSSASGVRINTPGGEIELGEALEGAVLYTGGGAITVGRARGLVDAQTGAGRIDIGPVEGSVRAVTGAGDVEIRLADAPSLPEQIVDVTTGTGTVVVELPRNFDGRFEIETAYTESHGPVSIDSDWSLQHEPVTGWEAQRGTPRRFVRARGTAGSGRGLVRIRATNGNVTLRRGE